MLPFINLMHEGGFATRVCVTVPSKNWRPNRRLPAALRMALLMVATAMLVVQRLLQIIVFVPRSDVVLLQKSLTYRLPLLRLDQILLLVARRHGVRVVHDIDDAVDVGTSQRVRRLTSAEAVMTARGSNLTVVGSHELVTRMQKHGARVAMIPTCAPAAASATVRAPRPTETLRLCWTGVPVNLIHLVPLLPALRELSGTLDLSLVVVTRLSHIVRTRPVGLNVRYVSWSPSRERAVLRTSHVRLAPLDSTPWTTAKCGARVLTYFSAGLPVIASPVGAQGRLVQHGSTGLLATTPAEWAEGIRLLVTDTQLHRRFAHAGLEVADRFSHDAWYCRWRDLVLGTADATLSSGESERS